SLLVEPPLAALVALGLPLSPPFLEAARMAAPDTLSTLAVFLSFWSTMRRRWSEALAFGIAVSFVRPDQLILLVPVVCHWILTDRGFEDRRRPRMLAGGFAVACLGMGFWA